MAYSFSGSLVCSWAPTLVNVIAAKVGPVRVVGQEVSQESGEVVAMPQHQVGAQHMLVHEAQVEVIAEGVHVHQVPHLVTLLGEQHGQLGKWQPGAGLGHGSTGCPAHSHSHSPPSSMGFTLLLGLGKQLLWEALLIIFSFLL